MTEAGYRKRESVIRGFIDGEAEGLPEDVPAGRVALRFLNDSEHSEAHELILLRRPDGDTTPVADLAMKAPDELMGTYSMAGVVFADQAGMSNTVLLDLEPGSYVAICTIPVGQTTTTHAMSGMVADLEVTA